MLRERFRFMLVGPGRWGRVQFLIGLTIVGAVLPNVLMPASQVRSSYAESYHEAVLRFGLTVAGAVIGGLGALLALAFRDRRKNARESADEHRVIQRVKM